MTTQSIMGNTARELPYPVRIFRRLRFRLTFAYVLLFYVLLAFVGLLFRETLRVELDSDTQATLEEEWGAAKGYLRIENGSPVWIEDRTDPEEDYIVQRLRHVYLLADYTGKVLDRSETYASIGVDSPQEIARILKLPQPEFHMRQDANGVSYLIKAGAMQGNKGRLYFLALGRSLDGNERTVANVTRRYSLLLLGVIALTTFLGWILAARALLPLNLVARAAQEITGSNLSLKIPTRGAGDELDHLIDSFNRMTGRLSQSFDQIRRFSTDVSHELRTPLTAIRGQLEVALFTASTPDQYRDAMVNALEDVEKLSSIVRALLLLSQAESGQLVLQKAPLDLSEVAADIVDQFQIPAEEKQLDLAAQLTPGTFVYADRIQIERLFSNLLSNAVKYTPQGGTIRVRVGPDENWPNEGRFTEIPASDRKISETFGDIYPGEPRSWVRITVEDSGVGIPPENLPHIFDRFYRVRNQQTNQIQGLGLGLSFVTWIVSAHDGTISAASNPGEGARFTVRFPAAAPAPSENTKPALASSLPA